MEKMSYGEMRDLFIKHNENADAEPLVGVVVYKQENFKQPFSEVERSYRVSSDNYGFMPGKISRSIWADCLDGKNDGVRLDWYGWSVEYCYLESEVPV